MAEQVFKIKQGDLRPYLKGQLVTLDDDGEVEGPQQLSGATIVFTMVDAVTKVPVIIEQGAVILDALEGLVQYEWQNGDTDTPGNYLGEFEATWGGVEPETYPNGKLGFKIKITPELA